MGPAPDRGPPQILGSAHSINRLLAADEVVDAKGRAEVGRCLSFPIFKRRTGGIGDAIYCVEEARHRGGIDQRGGAQGAEQRSARLDKGASVIAEGHLGEGHELSAMNNAAVSGAGHDNREIEGVT